MGQAIRMVGLVVVVLAALALSADADQLYIEFNDTHINNSALEIDHTAGATEGYDSGDATFLAAPAPALDIYSSTTFPGHEKLGIDARPLDSMTTITAEICGRQLTSPVSNALLFSIYDAYGENAFATKNIFADLYTPTDTLLGTYNVKDYAASGDTIPITVNNGLSYKLDIRFVPVPEPSTLVLLAIAAIGGLFAWRRRRQAA